ncbi:uroplakin-2 [Spea bombifrons]|uniref:uroplakin-2 n=1 Tax=Spea bombifrons TaxID=233779 RepID=UPI00234B164D|nr:uroplakin-2 [Spea bombifrons]
MQLLGVVAALFIISSATAQNTNSTLLSTEVLYQIFAKSVVIALPGCKDAGKPASLTVTSKTNSSNPKVIPLTVPQCRLKRDLIVLNNTASGNIPTINVGYQVIGLNPNTEYTAYYTIDSSKYSELSFTTLKGFGDPPVVFARSGGMVVITVLLSIAMFLLLLLLVVTLILGGGIRK